MERDSSPADARLWQTALTLAREIETDWDNPTRRLRAITACRQWLEAQAHQPRLQSLARLAEPQMSPRQLWSLLTPLERVAGRERVTDATILSTDGTVAAAANPMPLTIVADNIRSAFNIGGLFRTADCLGASALWLCGYSATPDDKHVTAADMGSAAHLPWQRFDRLDDALATLHKANIWTLALETVANATPIHECQWQFPCAIILGNERFGLEPAAISSCAAVTRIPTYGYKNSLNVVSALAIAGWCARRAWETGTSSFCDG